MKRFVFLVLALCASIITPAQAETRLALVIGNAAYSGGLPPLRSPAKDAGLMARTLGGLGFQVQSVVNGNQRAIRVALRAFSEKIDKAGRDTVALLYYSGHGASVDGENYIIPTGADLRYREDIPIEAVSANRALQLIQAARPRMTVVILDACRDNPLPAKTKSLTKGLVVMSQARASGTLIGYATAPGEVAFDGGGDYSPYTKALAETMTTKGLAVEAMFRQVRNKVYAATNQKQTPWENSALIGDSFYFAGKGNGTVAVTPPAPQPAISDARLAWQSIQNSTNPGELGAFILTFPNSPFAGIARAKRQSLLDARNQQQAAVVVPPKPAPQPNAVQPAVGLYPGKTFKDCADCPEMVIVPAGRFKMGSNDGASDEKPVHEVTIGRAFAVGKYEVTQAQWRAVMGSDPSKFKGDNLPVEQVSWDDAQDFLRKLSAKTGKQYRLLSEAEWEYAARAGTTTKYAWGNGASHDHANYGKDECCGGLASGRDRWEDTSPAGSFQGNAFGLHDMHGNVWEWVEDCWNKTYDDGPHTEAARTTGNCTRRVLRGGSWINMPWYLRAADRLWSGATGRSDVVGFRIARTL